jgi:hypothetical protein
MTGGDLMDVLVAEAKVIKRRVPQGTWKRGPFASKVRTLGRYLFALSCCQQWCRVAQACLCPPYSNVLLVPHGQTSGRRLM